MKTLSRNIVFVIVAAALVVLVAWGLFALWARPGRLSESDCRDLVTRAWKTSQAGDLKGAQILSVDIAGRIRNTRFDGSSSKAVSEIADRLRKMFPQGKPDDAFFGRVSLRHEGRGLAGGRICERVGISPAQYKGDSIELWIDPSSGYPLSWRRYDYTGGFVSGYRFRRARFDKAGPEGQGLLGDNLFADSGRLSGILEGEALDPERVMSMDRDGEISLPKSLPAGFKLTGGRILPGAEILQALRRGRGAGGGPGMGPMMDRPEPAFGPIQIVYSDGLNTVSVIEYRHPRLMELFLRTGDLDSAINAKAKEIRRIFRTSMTGKMVPGALILFYGEVAPEVLNDIAASLPDQGFAPPPMPPMGGPGSEGDHGPQPPEGFQLPPAMPQGGPG